jgi:glycosyltransferase involved in cell wall biosynthesis
MKRALLDALPAPPAHKQGWPWDQACEPLPPALPNGQPWPRISIVTPSFNQGALLEATLRSILLQGYPKLEYSVIDGGSSDESVEVIKRYEKHLAYWVSEPDRGHAHAINKGFARAGGELMAWLNSDDIYLPNALRTVAEILSAFPEIEWLTSAFPASCDLREQTALGSMPGFSPRFFAIGGYIGLLPYATGWLQQESTFWRRSLWLRAGGRVNEEMKLAVDFELWRRFFRFAQAATVEAPLGCFRVRPEQRSVTQADEYVAEALQCLRLEPSAWLSRLAHWHERLGLRRWLSWRRVAQLLYGERVPVITARSGAWQKEMKRLA